MSQSITVTLPIPPRELSPNHTVGSRGGRLGKAAKTRHYRENARWSTLPACLGKGLFWSAATVRIRWHTKTKRRPDADNALASLKAAFDGFTDAGIWTTDRNVRYEPIDFAIDRTNPRVEITISPTQPDGGDK